MEKGWIRICPACKSDRVELRPYIGVIYVCAACGFHGSMFPEITKEEHDEMLTKSSASKKTSS